MERIPHTMMPFNWGIEAKEVGAIWVPPLYPFYYKAFFFSGSKAYRKFMQPVENEITKYSD